MPGDETPEMSQEDDSANNAPTGDLAILARNVGLGDTSSSAQARDNTRKTNKNKGVGKGCSGSSGPAPKRKRANNLVQMPVAEESDDDEDVEIDENAEPGATQHITVGLKRGYSVYPGYLFDIPPKRIRVEHLRKQFMISEIARARAERRYYRHTMTLIGCLKEFMRMFAAHYNFQGSSNNTQSDEHAYAMNINDTDTDEEDVDIDGQK